MLKFSKTKSSNRSDVEKNLPDEGNNKEISATENATNQLSQIEDPPQGDEIEAKELTPSERIAIAETAERTVAKLKLQEKIEREEAIATTALHTAEALNAQQREGNSRNNHHLNTTHLKNVPMGDNKRVDVTIYSLTFSDRNKGSNVSIPTCEQTCLHLESLWNQVTALPNKIRNEFKKAPEKIADALIDASKLRTEYRNASNPALSR